MSTRNRSMRSGACFALHAAGLPRKVRGLVALLVLAATGCEVPQPPPSTAAAGPPEPVHVDPESEQGQQLQQEIARREQAAQAAARAAAAEAAKDAQDGPPASDGGAAGDAAATDGGNAQEGAPPATGKIVTAQAGAGKWKPYRPGYIATSMNAYFSTKERLAYLQVEDSLKKFRAIMGRKPKDLAEVEEKILGPKGLILPELEGGDTYVYVPDEGPNGAVMIQRKAD